MSPFTLWVSGAFPEFPEKENVMKKAFVKMAAVLFAAAMLAGCGGQIAKEEVGAVVGAGLGGLAGSFIGDGGGQLVAVAVGTMVGAVMGAEVGKSLDRADRLALAEAQHEALEYGKSGSETAWNNPDSGTRGVIVPKPAYEDGSGSYCREYWQTITVAGEKQQGYGTACRQADGSWRLS